MAPVSPSESVHRSIYTVAVRELCEFAAKQGDLDLRFTPSPSAREGIAGHRSVAACRSTTYRSEVCLAGRYGRLRVRGRADGWDPIQNRLEEIKTFKGPLERQPANHRALHWAQARVYGHLMCVERSLGTIELALVYFDVQRQQETVLCEPWEACALQQWFEALCDRFVAWADQELAHRKARDASLAALTFPHGDFRGGQRTLAEQVFRAARLGRCLMAQAPTGIGKTIGTLFPMLKAMPDDAQALEKVFFLTAKRSGQSPALQAIDTLRRGAPPMKLRVIELVAREKACEHPELQCHGASCPLARGFYDRLPAARADAVVDAAQTTLTRERQRTIALEHSVCPYYFGQELARWADVVIGDYHYYFDASGMLHGLTVANNWRVAVLVDEAHNLVDRARQMYSATLDHAELCTLADTLPAPLRPALSRVRRQWTRLSRVQASAYAVFDEPPEPFADALRDCVAAFSDHLAQSPADGAAALDAHAMRFFFDAVQFTRLIESFGAHSLFDLTEEAGSSSLCIRNVVPAPFLKPLFAVSRATVLFSATLAPPHFYADTLGLPDDTAVLDVDSPFAAEQLQVHIAHDVSTRWHDRKASIESIARLIADTCVRTPGPYFAFFSSYDYLREVADAVARIAPALPMWEQTRGMRADDQQAYLARFEPGAYGIGFAVLGGSFAEGIDLPGTRLIGAFIATLGLPQFNPVNEAMRQRLDEQFGTGHDYIYLYPGLRKVVQAAGRVIRTPEDRGSIYLIDDRYARRDVRALLPRWWKF